ncbi:MAG: hypothetical protein AAGC88_08925 [Bacteroidota bacterium]
MSLAIIVATALSTWSCGDDDEAEAVPLPISPADITASNPDWTIVSFTENGENKTADFNNYTFEIFSNGDFLVNLNGSNDSFGGWSISGDDLVLNISLSNPKPGTSSIDGDWNVTSKSGNALTLRSVDGNSGFQLAK